MDKHTTQTAPAARGVALHILQRVDEGAFSDQLLEQLGQNGLTAKDQALVREIVLGTLRWRRRIDSVLNTYLDQPLDRLPGVTLTLLRLSTYQLRHLDRVPAYAVVSEAVDLARQRDSKRARLVNAVLRGIADRRKPEPSSTSSDSDGTRLALSQSFPQWLVNRWVDRYGIDRSTVALEAMNARQPVSIRVCQSNATAIQLNDELSSNGFEPRPHPDLPDLFYVDHASDLFATQAFSNGWFIAQGPSAARIIDSASIRPGHTVLDVCAAPGGKACVAAVQTGPTGTVLATDRSVRRLRRLTHNVRRLRQNVRIVCADDAQLPTHVCFDRVLVDVPCTGLGTIGRHPEIKWKRTLKDLEALPRQQSRILRFAAERVKMDGLLVYSTCTTEPEENEHVIRHFLDQDDRFRIVPFGEAEFLALFPERPGDDGGFAAKLARIR